MVESKPWWPQIMNQTSTCWLLFLSFVFFMFCACFFMITETIFIGSAERPPNTLCQHGPNHETQYNLFALIIIIITAGCEDPNSKYYWSGRSTRKERRCSQIGVWPLKAKLGTINKYLEILPPLLELPPRDEKGCNQCWCFLLHIEIFFTQFQMTLLSYIAIHPF